MSIQIPDAKPDVYWLTLCLAFSVDMLQAGRPAAIKAAIGHSSDVPAATGI
ncbi:hypothetical protein E4U30_000871 [Claviceps sp. LM220 group G6]|nr:hypothetical protein E4U30_000871 [Claviceps sp. LM220 group G6]